MRSITAVETSVTAFVGAAVRGPVDLAVRLGSFADYEQCFGGLHPDSEMSWSIRQFFDNGGAQAWAVRVVLRAEAARCMLYSDDGEEVLQVTSLEAGLGGNDIQVRVARSAAGDGFDLSLVRTTDGAHEHYRDLSLDAGDRRYAVDSVNAVSQLVRIESRLPAGTAVLPKQVPEVSTLASAEFAAGDLQGLPSAEANSFGIALDDGPMHTVALAHTAAAGADLPDQLTNLASRIQEAVQALDPADPAYAHFACIAADHRLVLSTGTRGAAGAVRVAAAPALDLAAGLHLLEGASASLAADLLLAGGSEVAYGPADVHRAFIADRATGSGLYALDSVDLFNLLVLPGVTDAATLADADAFCRERRAFLIIDAPLGERGGATLLPTPADMVAAMTGKALPESDQAAVYYPWIYVADPLRGGERRLTAPSGSLAGLYARTDAARGVWRSPAGSDATIRRAEALAHPVTPAENGRLNPLGVNCLRSFPGRGVVCWGGRTLAGTAAANSDYKYIGTRRLALFIEESLLRGTRWTAFEPNDEALWAQIRLHVGQFMNSLFLRGAFQGATPRDAYLVKCDGQTHSQHDIAEGIVNILVGFAPVKPAEFVVLTIRQTAAQVPTRAMSAEPTQPPSFTLVLPDGSGTNARVDEPAAPRAALVLAHGAGAGMHHPFMEAVAVGLAQRGIACLRFNFPFMDRASRRPDPPALAHAVVRAACAQAQSRWPQLPLFAGGKSYGGRMASQAQAAKPLPGVRGLVFIGFPLHPANRPGSGRAEHLAQVPLPMLFVQGTRDPLAELTLVRQVVERCAPRATLHIEEGADHAFHVLVRSGRTDARVLESMLDAIAGWMKGIAAH